MTSTQKEPVKVAGIIENYKIKRGEACFVFTEADQTKFGVVAVAASLAGLGGQAVATAGYASSMEESADYLEFEVAGQKVQGWVWRSPFQEGDRVEVVGEYDAQGVLQLAAVARPVDKTIALYPHCSRGMGRHILNAGKWWLLVSLSFELLILCMYVFGLDGLAALERNKRVLIWGFFGSAVFFGVMVVSLARKWFPFVRVAEKVFRALGWPNPSMVDLVKSSKAQRRPDDPGEYGTFYFRY